MPLPSARPRLAASAAIGAICALLVLWTSFRFRGATSDFDQVWFAARAVLRGENPYPLIGPGRAFEWGWPLAYPLTGALVVTPLAPVPVEWARAIFAGGGAGALAYAVLGCGWPALTVCASLPFLVAVRGAQWSPWVSAGMMGLPIAAWAAAAKPNVGMIGGAARITSWQMAFGVVLVGIAFVLQPGWVSDWRAAVQTIDYFTPYVLRPGGQLLLLAVLRWRRPEARVLVAASLIPGPPAVYDSLIPFTAVVALGGSSLREALVLTIISFGVLPFMTSWMEYGTFRAYAERQAAVTMAFVLLPLLIAVMRRPNQS